MTDRRFYRPLGPVTARELAEVTGSSLLGDPAQAINDLAPADGAGPEDLTYLADLRHASALRARRPGGCIAPDSVAARIADSCGAVLVNELPRIAMARAAARLWAPIDPDHGEHLVSPDAEIDASAVIGPGAAIGPHARIGARTVIGPNAVVGQGVHIGADCRIGAGTHIAFASIGDRTEIGSNCVIGGAGFGVAPGPDGPVSIPHLGAVSIGRDVRLGSLCTIDRGMFLDTVIEDLVKMDNLCHIAHNCRVGRGVIMAAFAGISGSTTIGPGARLGGRVGVADHLTIGAGAELGASSGLMSNVPPGERWQGVPAKPSREFFREVAALRRLAARKPRGQSGGSQDGEA